MTDSELLEIAEQAAGIDGYFDSDDQNERDEYWNPLTNDGDALRLAVKLNMNIDVESDLVCADHATLEDAQFETVVQDPYAATRRAIVRAAAEIGRSI